MTFIPSQTKTDRRKIFLTALILLLVLASGSFYQYSYHLRREKYREIITGYYRKYLHREPDAIGLRHWTAWALNKWNLEKVERAGFIEVAERLNHA